MESGMDTEYKSYGHVDPVTNYQELSNLSIMSLLFDNSEGPMPSTRFNGLK